MKVGTNETADETCIKNKLNIAFFSKNLKEYFKNCINNKSSKKEEFQIVEKGKKRVNCTRKIVLFSRKITSRFDSGVKKIEKVVCKHTTVKIVKSQAGPVETTKSSNDYTVVIGISTVLGLILFIFILVHWKKIIVSYKS